MRRFSRDRCPSYALRRTERRAYVAFASSAILTACLTHARAGDLPTYVFPGTKWDTTSPESQGLDPDVLKQKLEALGDRRGNVVVVRNGYKVYVDGSEAERYPIYSVSKTVTAMISARLLQQSSIPPTTW